MYYTKCITQNVLHKMYYTKCVIYLCLKIVTCLSKILA